MFGSQSVAEKKARDKGESSWVAGQLKSHFLQGKGREGVCPFGGK